MRPSSFVPSPLKGVTVCTELLPVPLWELDPLLLPWEALPGRYVNGPKVGVAETGLEENTVGSSAVKLGRECVTVEVPRCMSGIVKVVRASSKGVAS